MNHDALLTSLRDKICRGIDIEPDGAERYVVYTPFMFDDGDHFVSVLRKDRSGWIITDEGHTFMHLSYSNVDVSTGSRAKIVEEALAAHGVENHNGELRIAIPGDQYGDALYSYLQAVSRIATVTQLTQQRVASTFLEDVRGFLSETLPPGRANFDWHDPQHDPDGNYAVDCRINGSARPWFVFAVNTPAKCSHATIACLMFERWGIPFRSLALFEDQTKIPRKPLAQLTDVVDKQFSSLGDRNRIEEYIRQDVLSA